MADDGSSSIYQLYSPFPLPMARWPDPTIESNGGRRPLSYTIGYTTGTKPGPWEGLEGSSKFKINTQSVRQTDRQVNRTIYSTVCIILCNVYCAQTPPPAPPAPPYSIEDNIRMMMGGIDAATASSRLCTRMMHMCVRVCVKEGK